MEIFGMAYRKAGFLSAVLSTTLLSGGGGALYAADKPEPLYALKSNHQHAPVVKKQSTQAGGRIAGRSKNRKVAVVNNSSEDLHVSGKRRVVGVQDVVSSAEIHRAVPGTNPLKALSQHPGVMFQSSDPQGLGQWTSMLYMHGFQQDQIGMTVEGIPIGDQEFHSFNGLNSAQAITSENLERMDVSLGAGAESIAATNNLGGSLQFIGSDPGHVRKATIGQTFGSNSLFHTYVRGDSGDLTKRGDRFYVSYMRNDTKRWKGGGHQFMQQVNFKLVDPIGEHSSLSTFFNYSDFEYIDYQDMSFDSLKNGGYYLDNFIGTPNGYQKAYQAALGIFPSSYSNIVDKTDASYYAASTTSRNYIGGTTYDFELADRLHWKGTVYGHGQYGRGSYTSPYSTSPNGAPLAEQITVTQQKRFGFTSSLNYTVAKNDISAGVWYENFSVNVDRNAYEEPLLGQGKPVNPVGSLPSPYATFWGMQFNSNSFTAYLQDTYHPLKNVSLHVGFKSILQTVRAGQTANMVSYTGTDSLAVGSVTSSRPFLPHISGDWRFLRDHELYFDIAENMKTLPMAAYKQGASPFALTGEQYEKIKNTIKPETNWTYSVGYRYNSPWVSGTVFAYRSDFSNRLQQITAGTIVNPVSSVANVGSIAMNGVDAGLVVRPLKGLSISSNVSYNHATYGSNISENGVTYHIKGQQIVNYPRFMYKANVVYTIGDFTTHFDATYMGKRNYSYTGDLKVPSYWVENAGVRWMMGKTIRKLTHSSLPEDLSIDFNVYNLANQKYISVSGENGNAMYGDYQSFFVGAPRQYFGSIRMSF